MVGVIIAEYRVCVVKRTRIVLKYLILSLDLLCSDLGRSWLKKVSLFYSEVDSYCIWVRELGI